MDTKGSSAPASPPTWIMVIIALITAILSQTGRGDLVLPVIIVSAIVCGLIFAIKKKE